MNRIAVIFCFIPLISFTQIKDTTLIKLDTASNNEIRAKILSADGWKLLNGSPEVSIEYAKFALKDSSLIKDKAILNSLYRLMAFSYGDMNNRKATMKWHLKRLALLEGDTAYYRLRASANFETGGLLTAQDEFELAKKYFEESYELAVKANDPVIQGQALIELSALDISAGKFEKSREDLLAARELFRPYPAIQFMVGYAEAKIANVYQKEGKKDSALIYARSAIQFIDYERYPDINGEILYISGEIFGENNLIDSSIWLAHRARVMFEENKKLFNLPDVYSLLAKEYEKINVDSALTYIKMYVEINDSVLNTENNNNIAALQFEYEDEKKQKEIKLLKQENELAQNREKLVEAESKRKDGILKTIIIALVIALVLLAALIFLLKQLRRKSREIRRQKSLIEKRSMEIDDSINYAKRIQMAMIPNEDIRKEVFKDSFILYKPKDVLSGDFHWCKEVTTSSEKRFKLFAVGDCTGHGVPGALLSILGVNYLNLGAVNPNINSPAEALDFLNSGILSTFEKSKDIIRDGMDIVMGALDMSELVLHYACAKNPIYIVRAGELITLKGDKFPVGNESSESDKLFTSHSFQLRAGDMIYSSSDGYQDQFGGERGKKYKLSNFKKLLVRQSDLNLVEQAKNFEEIFIAWKNDYDQVDDICIFGIRV